MARNPTIGARQIQHGVNVSSNIHAVQQPNLFKQNAQAFGLAGARTGLGFVQAGSGLVDLASPGKGTSRVSKLSNNLAVKTDKAAQRAGVNAGYKTFQAPLNVATFLTPGAVSEAVKGGQAAVDAAKTVPKVTSLSKLGAKYLPGNDAVGRIAGSAVKGTFNKSNALNSAGMTALQVGTNASKGGKTTPRSVATTAGQNLAFGGGMNLAGTVAKEGAVAGIKGAKAGVNAVTPHYAGLKAHQVIMDTNKLNTLHNALGQTKDTPVHIQNDTINGLHQIKQDHGLDFITGSPESRRQRISQYLEQNGEAIPQLQAHQAKVAARPSLFSGDPAVAQGGYIRLPSGEQVDRPLYHGSPHADTIRQEGFKPVAGGLNMNGEGTYLTTQRSTAKSYADGVGKNVVRTDVPKDARILKMSMEEATTANTKDLAKQGYDGIEVGTDPNHSNIVMFDPSKIKARPATPKLKRISNLTDNDMNSLTPSVIEHWKNQGFTGVSNGKRTVKFDQPKSIGEKLGIKPLDQSGHIGVPKKLQQVGGRNLADSSEGSIAPSTAPVTSTKLVPPAKDVAPQTPKVTTKLVGEVPESGALGNDTPAPVQVNDYLKQQTKLQDVARQQGELSGTSKFKAGLADQKAKFIDSFAPIEDRLNQKITKDNATSHITPKIDRALRADTISGQYIKDNGLADIIQSADNTKELDQYLIAKHAPAFEREHGKGSSGRNLAADAQLVKELAPKYEEHAKTANAYSQKLLDQAVNYGLISKESAQALKTKYPDYVPMNRIFGEDELTKPPKGVGGGKASISGQSVVQKAKGSQRAIESPLNSLVHKTQDVIEQGERNQAAQALISTKDLPDNPFNLRELKPSEAVGAKHVVSYLDNGKVRRFETDKVVADAAKSLTKQQLGLVGQILNVPVRVLRLGATSLNPAFVGANAIKDLASGAINSANPLRSSVGNPHVFMQALKASLNHNSAEYGELVRQGAGGTSFDIARNQPIKNVAAIRAGRNTGSKIAYTVTHPSQLLRAAENTIGRSEELSRALQYYGGKQAAEKAGATAEQAQILGAHAGRNNTVNFARAGDYGRVLNSVVPYLNAGAQGSRTLIRSFGDRPAQTSAKLVLIGFLPVATATAWNVGDPRRKEAYDDIKDYEKQNNIIIVPPNPQKDPKTGKWNVIKIPVSQEIANLNNVVRNGVETATKDGSLKVGQILGDVAGSVTSLNLGSPRQAFNQVLPQAAKPIVEGLTNQNLYTGNKIIPDSQKNLDGRDQYGDYTSGTAKTIGRLTNISPRQIDNFVRTTAGGLGQNAINASDNALAKAGVIKPTDIQGKSVQSSVVGRFTGAQGTNKYDIIDKQSADLTKQLKALPGYKTMSSADKAKALNRLTNAVTGTYTSTKELTPKQQAIDNGSVKVSDYLTPATKTGSTQATKDLYKSPDAEYKALLASSKTATYNSPAAKITADAKLAKAKVGAGYDKSIRDAYDLSNAQLYDYVHNDPNGNDIVKKVLAYSQALKDAGITSTAKFMNKYGQVTLGKASGGSSGGRRRSSGRTAKVKTFKPVHISVASKSIKAKSVKAPSFKAKRSAIPKLAKVQTPKVTKKKVVA